MTRSGLRRALPALALAVLAATSVACDFRVALTFSPDTLPDASVGRAYSVVIAVADNVTPVGGMWAVDLPPGLSFEYDRDGHASSGELRGTPTAAGSYKVTVGAWCLGTNVSGQTGERQYTLVVR